ncbi:hypothetical protein WN944_015091 [Citrus x changshan-huyou]|uniref:Pectate lyase domain-containing protein n=1 Tax=Citrus x changshan-huyou TaxID=2935761 RepID=A0AAP0QQR3_9ROSI
MTNNVGKDVVRYKVTDPGDDTINPKPGTLRYEAILIPQKNGLIDVTRGSTDVTISNNWFRNQDKIKLLGHDDGYIRDKNMKMTIAYNHFGRNCNQRMPRTNETQRNFFSVGDLFKNGDSFTEIGSRKANLKYTEEQKCQVANAKSMRSLTSELRVSKCSRRSRC